MSGMPNLNLWITLSTQFGRGRCLSKIMCALSVVRLLSSSSFCLTCIPSLVGTGTWEHWAEISIWSLCLCDLPTFIAVTLAGVQFPGFPPTPGCSFSFAGSVFSCYPSSSSLTVRAFQVGSSRLLSSFIPCAMWGDLNQHGSLKPIYTMMTPSSYLQSQFHFSLILKNDFSKCLLKAESVTQW